MTSRGRDIITQQLNSEIPSQVRYKKNILSIKLSIFPYPSVLSYVLGSQKNRLIETVLLSTHNICFS